MRFLGMLFSCWILIFCPLSAQTLHSFLIADTNHPETGKGHSQNLLRMQLEINAVARKTGLALDTIIIKGTDLTAENVRNKLENFRCEAEDVVIFYFSGTEYLPTRYRGNSNEALLNLNQGFISPSGVNELIEIQKPKLTVVITDLCNQTNEEQKLIPKVDKGQGSGYEKLFLKSSGKLFFNNHIAREQSELALSSDGGVFTGSVIQAIRESENWDNVINRSRALTIGYSQGTQNPQANAQLSTSVSEKIAQNNEEQPQKEPELSEKKPKNVSLRQEVSAVEIKTTEVDASMQQLLNQEATQAVEEFQKNLTRLAEIGTEGNYAESMNLTQKTLSLFTDNRRIIETSGLSQRVSKKLIGSYLKAFYKANSARKTEISWYKAPEIGKIKNLGNQKYMTEITVYQEYLKKDRNGNIVYGDRVPKTIQAVFTPDENAPNGYQVQFGNIRVAGRTEKSSKK